MISRTLKFTIAVCIGCCLTALLPGCVGQRSASGQEPVKLPLGLYKVIERECSYAPGVPEDCSKTRYIELVKGIFYGIDKDEIAFATWMASEPAQEHDYMARDLRQGRFVNAQEFLVEDDARAKEWFVIKDGTITDYFFTRRARQGSHEDMAGKTHLTLTPVPRTSETDRLVPYPVEE